MQIQAVACCPTSGCVHMELGSDEHYIRPVCIEANVQSLAKYGENAVMLSFGG